MKSLAGLTAALVGVSFAAATDHPWGYSAANKSVAPPECWADYYPTCGGHRQSPIDISTTELCHHSTDEYPLWFDGECSDFTLSQTHEVFKSAVTSDSTCTVDANGAMYDLVQFHLHAPSEHTLDGEAYDAEAHFVHNRTDGGSLLVIGLFFTASDDAETDPFFAEVIDTLGDVDEETATVLTLGSYSNLIEKAATGGHVFNYPGSLTTPGCSEIVDWWVVQKPLQISTDDLAWLHQRFEEEFSFYDDGYNARPVQPLYGRTVTPYSASA